VTIQDNESSIGSDFKIAFIADTHNYYDELNKLVNTINRNGPYSFIVVCGDITNYGLLEEYKETKRILQRLNYPYLVAVGNHDLLSNGNNIFLRMFGKTEFDFTYKNIQLIFFNNNNWESGGVIPNKKWVEMILKESTPQFRIMVSHVSPRDTKRFNYSMIAEWEDLMTTYGVNYYINGHDHNPTEYSFGSGVQITTGAPSKGFYYGINVTSGGITHQKISF
jgi:3',5'-cyclic AMP phosphodiesterase CpdA